MYPNMHVHMFPWGIQRCGIGRGRVDPWLQIMTDCFWSSCTNLHSHQLYLRFHVFPCFCQYLILSDFLAFVYLVDMKWLFIMVFIFIIRFLVRLNLVLTKIFHFAKCLFKSLTTFSTGLFLGFVLLWVFWYSKY